jgi:hypothetical protein
LKEKIRFDRRALFVTSLLQSRASLGDETPVANYRDKRSRMGKACSKFGADMPLLGHVRFRHLADDPVAPGFVGFWTKAEIGMKGDYRTVLICNVRQFLEWMIAIGA